MRVAGYLCDNLNGLRYILCCIVTGVNGLQNVSVDIPEAVAVGSTVNLTCQYDLQGDVLYAVKWYKGKDEFYRYLPKEMPPISTFGDFRHKIIVSYDRFLFYRMFYYCFKQKQKQKIE